MKEIRQKWRGELVKGLKSVQKDFDLSSEWNRETIELTSHRFSH